MLKVKDMAMGEMQALLLRVGFGHLGCTRDGHPYVVPMHYAYDGQDIYFFTTEGTKTEFIAANHEVCFQVEEITDASNWRSVMVIGEAHKVTKPDETERAMQLITERNATLTPALNKTDIGAWHRLSNIAIYRVQTSAVYGRRTVRVEGPRANEFAKRTEVSIMIVRLSEDESHSLLKDGGLARLGYVLDDEPHIVPVNYVLEGDCAYIHSLPGDKITALRANPRACLQVDELEDQFHWRSVLAFGDFEEVREQSERNYLLSKILARFPQLTPVEAAIAQDAEPPTVILFRIRIDRVSGVGEL